MESLQVVCWRTMFQRYSLVCMKDMGISRMVLPLGGRMDEFTGLPVHIMLGTGFLLVSHVRGLQRCKRQENYDQLFNSSLWI